MMNLKTYGCTEIEAIPDGLLPGRVTELRRERFTVMTERGEVTAVLKGAFYHSAETRADFPCVGDFVLLHYNESGDSLITAVLPRRSKFSRADYSGHDEGRAKTVLEQVVATNFDYVFILSSLNLDFNVTRIMRYLTQAKQSGGQPVIILTKADLAPDYNLPLAEVRQSIPDVPVHAICSHTGLGLSELDSYLRPGKTIVFLGMSGVGKSSLLNALMEQDVMKVQAIREVDSRGRHTTTHRQLFMLPSGAMVIDTPGMRELGLFDADEGIRAGFADVEEWFRQCRFTDCRHQAEPGCAVLAALEDGLLPRERWEQYAAQRQENKVVQDKTGYLIDKRARNKTVAMRSKQTKKSGGGKNKY
ncbi:ribosome small subunit-dependent GTPase A [Paenibacillus sambharensis]|uniref:Small ribosomal subunit biogenesis GTPase RsgA n=1 Tax=Paenibacillus sambharensis TaxID=1803190 RepID=A0A2W1LNP2_9BACL|nr:ribosome small subunit-dependent GTPase A [Paenibacillus sambharensis]PZD96552.1 ribosome small subunit-dependent GTPase A [Paenibacillus sambharensis]